MRNRFLLAKLYLDALTSKLTKKALRSALAGLKEGKTDYSYAYDATMRRIREKHPDEAKLAFDSLAWIVHARRPLSPKELQEALCVEPEEDVFDPENRPDIETIITACAGLVTVDEANDVIRLVHYTLQEYFESTHKTWFPTAHDMIFQTCAAYMTGIAGESIHGSGPFQVKQFHKRKLSFFERWVWSNICEEGPKVSAKLHWPRKENCLLKYATSFWGDHARLACTSVEEACVLLKNDAVTEILYNEAFRGRSSKEGSTDFVHVRTLHLAAYFGLDEVVDRSLQHSTNVNGENSDGRSALSIAAARGHESTLMLLLRNGACVDQRDTRGKEPLHLASMCGHASIVEQLLREGASIDAEDDSPNTALYRAVQCGQNDVVRLLIDRGASMKRTNDKGWTVLHLAAVLGELPVVKLLIEAGADVDALDNSGISPVLLAAYLARESAVEFLLDFGADPSIVDYAGRSLLHNAAQGGLQKVAERILESDTNSDPRAAVDFEDRDGMTALFHAAIGGQVALTEMLINKGAAVDHQDKHGRTALFCAAGTGRLDIVEILVDKGANVNHQDKDGKTALFRAARRGRRDVVEMLVDKGADFNHQDKYGHTALLNVSNGLHSKPLEKDLVDTACFLIDHGADVNHQNHAGSSALMWAACSNKMSLVRLLLDRGANPTLTDSDGRSALEKVRERKGFSSKLFKVKEEGSQKIISMLEEQIAINISSAPEKISTTTS